ncbi:hypothetical protein MBLNU230_g1780t1 [Neophaeotheca triangularis]
MSDRRPETTPPARTERRSSIGRLLERFKSKRKSSSQQVATTTTPAADTTSNQPAGEPTGPSATKGDAKHTEPKQAPPLAKDPAGTELHANDLDVDDNEDLTPSRFDQFSHSNEKTRALFEKHGIPAPTPSPGAPQLEKDEQDVYPGEGLQWVRAPPVPRLRKDAAAEEDQSPGNSVRDKSGRRAISSGNDGACFAGKARCRDEQWGSSRPTTRASRGGGRDSVERRRR